MRGKRSKQYRKLMHQYSLAFAFREPYQTLLTSDILLAASANKMSLGNLLTNTLHGEIKPMITQCCIRHLYNLSDSEPHKDACIAVAKAAERRRCGHHELEEPLSAEECVMSVVDPKESGTNRNRYVVATQERELRKRLRRVVGVPLVYISRSVMILEPMAPGSEKVKEGEERAKMRAGLKSSRRGEGEKRKREDEDEGEGEGEGEGGGGGSGGGGEQRVKKKMRVKGPKGPNPLSVKKTKKETQKSTARQVEDERSAARRATKSDPPVKAVSGLLAAAEGTNGDAEGTGKRKRKRKPKDVAAGAENAGDDAAGEN